MEPSLRILARSAAIALITCLCPATTQADDLCPEKTQARDFRALLLDANYSKPLRWNVGGSLFFSHDDGRGEGAEGIIVGGSVGAAGMQAWGGIAALGAPSIDFRGVVTRTWDNPRVASANSTYVGGEVGWGVGLRVSVGYAKRISGPSTNGDHIITWSVGAEIPWFR